MRIEANMGRGEGEEEGTEGQTHYVVEQFVAEVSAVKIIKRKKEVCQKQEMPCSCQEMFLGFQNLEFYATRAVCKCCKNATMMRSEF